MIDKSSGGTDIAQITITSAASNGVRNFRISGIKNRRSVGLSMPFTINTLTIDYEEVSESTNNVDIAGPSDLTGGFVA